MSPQTALERLGRGFGRMYAEARGANGRLADEIRIEGATALRAVAEDSAAGDIQAATQRNAWTVQIGRLEAIEKRTIDQELALRQYRRNIAELDAAEAIRHPTPQNMGHVRMGFLGPVGAVGGLSLGPLWLWVSGAFLALLALLGLQSVRLESAKTNLREARADLQATERALTDARQVANRLADEVRAADAQSQQSAQTIERERARSTAARRRERELLREIQERTADVGEPPTWSLRGDGRDEGSSTP